MGEPWASHLPAQSVTNLRLHCALFGRGRRVEQGGVSMTSRKGRGSGVCEKAVAVRERHYARDDHAA